MKLFNPPAPLPPPEEDEDLEDETELLPSELLVLASVLLFINTPEDDNDNAAAVPLPVDTVASHSLLALLVA